MMGGFPRDPHHYDSSSSSGFFSDGYRDVCISILTSYRMTLVALSIAPVKTSSVRLNESSLVIEVAVDS